MNSVDVIGIGALNIDFFSSIKNLSKDFQVSFKNTLENQSERFRSMEMVDKFIEGAGSDHYETMYGGSAFNTIQAIISLGLGLKTGFVGVAGGEAGGRDFWEHLRSHNIDTTFCYHEPTVPPGKCFAVVDGKDRKLITAEGANRLLVTNITNSGVTLLGTDLVSDFVNYLSSAKWIHLTSFISRETLSFLNKHIEQAKQNNPALIVSFDPGDDYSEEVSVEVTDFAQLSDYLFLSWREFRNFAKSSHGEGIKTISQRIFQQIGGNAQILVLKGKGSNFVIQINDKNEIFIRRYWHRFIPPIFIKDDVGAGDVFAAGFIAGTIIPQFNQYGIGPTKLGAALVIEKLKQRGNLGYAKFAGIARELILSTFSVEETNLPDLVRLYLPPVVKYGLAILSGIIATVIYQAILG